MLYVTKVSQVDSWAQARVRGARAMSLPVSAQNSNKYDYIR